VGAALLWRLLAAATAAIALGFARASVAKESSSSPVVKNRGCDPALAEETDDLKRALCGF
jgi:hypothetical protein